MKLLMENWRKFLTESQDYVEMDSPLVYHRAGNVKRIALRDSLVEEPPHRSEFGFADQYSYRNPRTGRMTKKKHLEAPGTGDDTIIGFLDYHSQGTTSDGRPYWYIDYMRTRGGFGGKGVATQLVDEFIQRYAPDPGSIVHFGKVMNPHMWHIKEKMAEKYPDHQIIGGKGFR